MSASVMAWLMERDDRDRSKSIESSGNHALNDKLRWHNVPSLGDARRTTSSKESEYASGLMARVQNRRTTTTKQTLVKLMLRFTTEVIGSRRSLAATIRDGH